MSHDQKFSDKPNNAEKLRRIRKASTEIGFTFRSSKEKFNGIPLYEFVNKKTKEIFGLKWTISSAYDALNDEGYWSLEHGNKFHNGQIY